MNTASQYNATVMARIDIQPRLTIFQVKPDDPDFTFTAGQYTTLGLLDEESGKLVKRAYSITSGSVTREYVEFYINLVSDGALTPRLFSTTSGARIFMGARAKGVFTIGEVAKDQSLLMVATGTGIAPYISMLRSHVIDNPDQRVTVLHGASYSWDLGFRNELEELDSRNDGFSYVPVISRPKESYHWKGMEGRLPAWLENPDLAKECGFEIDPENTHVFLCGNPGMIKNATEILTNKGFKAGKRKEPGNLHMEKFW